MGLLNGEVPKPFYSIPELDCLVARGRGERPQGVEDLWLVRKIVILVIHTRLPR